VTTAAESSAVKREIGLTKRGDIPDLKYTWGYVKEKGVSAAVAMVYLDDVTGQSLAPAATEKAVRYLAPDYILLVGTACGINRGKDKLAPGDIVISSYVHGGPLDTNHSILNPLKHDRVLPPCDFLLETASDVAEELKESHELCDHHRKSVHPKKGMQLAPSQPHRQVILDKHIVSCNVLQESEDDETLRKLVKCFPRFVAYEMEAGAIAAALWLLWQTRKGPGYLVVKGISDTFNFPPDRVEGKRRSAAQLSAAHKRERQRNTPKAARAAALFARRLMVKVIERQRKEGNRQPTPIDRLLPPGQTVVINGDLCGVVHKVTPMDYSKVAAANLNALIHEPRGGARDYVFTVCAFEPQELRSILERSFEAGNVRSHPTLDQLKKEADRNFPHFKLFSDLAKKRTAKCVRILLLRDAKWTTRLKCVEDWILFKRLNGRVNCWGVNRNDLLPDITFLTDYCVVGENLILDYYQDASTLVVSEVYDPKVSEALLGLKKKFEDERDRFIPWGTLSEQVRCRFQRGSVSCHSA
jgi:nucleoside phosphorylase